MTGKQCYFRHWNHQILLNNCSRVFFLSIEFIMLSQSLCCKTIQLFANLQYYWNNSKAKSKFEHCIAQVSRLTERQKCKKKKTLFMSQIKTWQKEIGLKMNIGTIIFSYSHATIGMLIRHGFLERCGDLPCVFYNNNVSFKFYLTVVSSALKLRSSFSLVNRMGV